MRSDALRNQKNIIEAARIEIATNGADVSMEQIARAAGVAVGTLYRHYPTKTDLVDAVIDELSEAIVERAESAARSVRRPGDAMARIVGFIADFMEDAATNHALKAAAPLSDHERPEQVERGRVALEPILQRARDDGDLREDITADDLYLMMISAPESLDKKARDRWLEIVVAGISA